MLKEIIIPTGERLPDFESLGQRNVAYRAYEIIPENSRPTLRCPTLEHVRKVAYASIYRRYAERGHANEGLALTQRFLEHDLQVVADLIIKGRQIPPAQRPPDLGAVLGYIQKSLVLSDLSDETLIDILYRRESGLEVLQSRGIIIDPSRQENRIIIHESGQVERPILAQTSITIPTNDGTLPDPGQIDVKPWEIYAVTSLLDQIGQTRLRQLGLPVSNELLDDIKKAKKNSEPSKGQLRNPDSVAQIFTKLEAISQKGPQAPLTSRSPHVTTLIDVFDGVPGTTIRKILSHELKITLPKL